MNCDKLTIEHIVIVQLHKCAKQAQGVSLSNAYITR